MEGEFKACLLFTITVDFRSNTILHLYSNFNPQGSQTAIHRIYERERFTHYRNAGSSGVEHSSSLRAFSSTNSLRLGMKDGIVFS